MSEETIDVYNATLGKVTPHTKVIDNNGEVVLTCTENGHFIKFPDEIELDKYIEEHNFVNGTENIFTS